VIDDFAILQLVGQGGMGDVYLAHQFSLDRLVALKILKAQFLEDPKFKEEFVQEARSVASLNHPNIIRAYKVGFEDGRLFFAMEYVEGENLNDILKADGAIEPSRVLEIAIDVAQALGYAWETSRLIHRDIKPDNIMISADGIAKVMDLGLSRRAGDVYDDSDIISGTPQYISPEQIMGDPMDIRGDFYSMGATLYHLVTGRFLFDGTLEEMIKKHMTEKPPSLKQTAPHVSEAFGRIIRKLVAKKPEDRYQDAESLVKDLKKAQSSQSSGSNSGKKKHITVKNFSSTTTHGMTPSKRGMKKPDKDSKNPKTARRLTKEKKKDPTAMILIGVVVGALLLGLILLFVFSGDSTARASTAKPSPAVKKVILTPREKRAMKDSRFQEAIKPEGRLKKGLVYSYYKGKMTNLAALRQGKVKVSKTGTTSYLDLSIRDSNDNFAVVFEGYLRIPQTDEYTFSLESDDGSCLTIGEKVIVDHGGLHAIDPAKTGDAVLEKGFHKFKLEYFQAASSFGLECQVESFSYDKQNLPSLWLLRDSVPK
jgi:serine/threonine protein kinase